MRISILATSLFLLAIAPVVNAQAPASPPRIDPQADTVLKQACTLLAGSKALTVESHGTMQQLLPSGQRIQVARNQKVAMRRPDGIAVDVTGDNEDAQMVYDGKTVSILNLRANTWAQTAAPASIDAALDMLATKYGIMMPLADLVFSDPYKSLAANVRSGQDLGIGYVMDTKCRHLAFRQESVDWEIWIDAGDKPLPMKLVITYKESPAHLEYTVLLSKWNLSADVPASRFAFSPPASAKKVEFTVPASQPGGGPR